jgi:peptidyl-prolyl cis-trans isomerase C
MKKRTLLAASAAVVVLAAQTPAAEQTSKKSKTAAKPAAEAKAKAPEGAPAADKPQTPEAKGFALKDPIAVVDGEEIKIAEVDKAIDGFLSQRGGSLKDVPEPLKPQLYRKFVESLIAEKLVTREAGKVEVSDADVNAELEKFKKQLPDEKTFDEQLKAQGQTVDGIKKEIHSYLQQSRWMEAQVKGKTDVTDAEAEAFYKENPDQFKQPEQVRASHILVKVEKDAKEDEVKAKREAANKILERVKKGEDFDKLATELSEDPSAKENHGDLNFFPREQMVPEFSEAAFKMKKGEVSAEPVRSDFGFHIIKVTDRKDGSTVPFAEAKPQLVKYLEGRKRQTEIDKVLAGLREKAKVTINLPEAPAPKTPAAEPDAPAPAPEAAAPEASKK